MRRVMAGGPTGEPRTSPGRGGSPAEVGAQVLGRTRLSSGSQWLCVQFLPLLPRCTRNHPFRSLPETQVHRSVRRCLSVDTGCINPINQFRIDRPCSSERIAVSEHVPIGPGQWLLRALALWVLSTWQLEPGAQQCNARTSRLPSGLTA